MIIRVAEAAGYAGYAVGAAPTVPEDAKIAIVHLVGALACTAANANTHLWSLHQYTDKMYMNSVYFLS